MRLCPLLFAFVSSFTPFASLYAETLHVALAANNEGYLEGAGVCIYSILKHADPADTYHFYLYITEGLAENGLPEPQQKAFDELQACYRQMCTIHITPLKNLPGAEGVDVGRWGLASLVRLFLPDLLPNVEKVVYLDCDMIALKDLKEVDATLTVGEDFLMAGVIDYSAFQQLKRLCEQHKACGFQEYEYINSGLLVMDLERLRCEHFAELTLAWLQDNNAQFPDQDAINVVYKGRIKMLDLLYAWPNFWNKGDHKAKAKVLHFTGEHKPWMATSAPNLKIYRRYQRESPWIASSFPYSLAIESGDLNELEALIALGFDVNRENLAKDTPLHEAVNANDLAMVDFLLMKGAHLDVRDGYGNTPLHRAAKLGFTDIVHRLIQEKVDPNAQNAHLQTPLHLAALYNRVATMPILFQAGADTELKDILGYTPLHVAVKGRCLKAVKQLCEWGAGLNAVDKEGLTPLFEAACLKDTTIAKYLVIEGAHMNVRNVAQQTPLHWGAGCGKQDLVELFIEKGAGLYDKDATGATAFDYAKEAGFEEVAAALKEHEAAVCGDCHFSPLL